MKVQVLVATMNRKNIEELLKNMNISTDAIITNQTDNFSYNKINYNGKNIEVYNFNERGIGLNRNNALMRATADIVILADDDLTYIDNYNDIIVNEFEKNPKADMIVFNVKNEDDQRKGYVITKNKRVYKHNCLRYGAVRMAFKLEKIKQKNLYFSLLFGGGAKYGSGEDSIFIYQCLKSGLKVYSSTQEILKLPKSDSTWFKGYNEKYFYDKGALMAAIFNKEAVLTIPIFLFKNYKTTNQIGRKKAYKAIMKGYKEFLNVK